MLRIGFIGTGLIAWAHALGLRAMIDTGILDAAVTAVYDSDETRAAGFAAANGAQTLPSTTDVLESCDALWVCTPTAAHPAAVEQAVGRGVAVFCEKPLAPDMAAADALARVVLASEVPAQTGLVLRSAPVFRALKEVISSGELGPPMAAVFRDDQYFPIQGLYGSSWRADARLAGAGCLIEHSIHDLDILRFCLGEVVEVAGWKANHAGHEGIEDVATVSVRFASGACASLVSVWHDILSRGSTRRVEVFCKEGMVWLDNDFRGPLHIQTSNDVEVRPCPSPDWVNALPLADDDIGLAIKLYVEADRAFVESVLAGHAPQPGFGEALIAHQLVDAAYRSAAAGGAPIALGA